MKQNLKLIIALISLYACSLFGQSTTNSYTRTLQFFNSDFLQMYEGARIAAPTMTLPNSLTTYTSTLQFYNSDNRQLYNAIRGIGDATSSFTNTCWGITGNAISTNTSFIGTTTNYPFNIKVNNIKSGIIDTLGSTSFGYKSSLLNSIGSNSNSTFGTNSCRYNISGVVNSGFGTSVFSSTAFAASSDCGFGYNSGRDVTTGGNLAYFGESAGRGNTTGSDVTAIGKAAFLTYSVNSGIALGTHAGRYATNKVGELFVGSVNRGSYANDTTYSILYGVMNTNNNNSIQRLSVNGNLIVYNAFLSKSTATISGNSVATTTLSGAFLPTCLTATATLDFPVTNGGTSSDLTITVTGATDGNVVMIGFGNAAQVTDGVFYGWVSAANTVTIRYANNSIVTAYNPASAIFKATVIKN